MAGILETDNDPVGEDADEPGLQHADSASDPDLHDTSSASVKSSSGIGSAAAVTPSKTAVPSNADEAEEDEGEGENIEHQTSEQVTIVVQLRIMGHGAGCRVA